MLAVFPTLLKEHVRQSVFRDYMSEAVRLIGETVAMRRGGRYLQSRYADIVSFKPEETRTEEEIIDRVRRALGGEQGESI